MKASNATHSLSDSNTVKDSVFSAQRAIVFHSFLSQPKTMLQVSVETGILRANICRYISNFREVDWVEVAHTGLCPISKHRANFYQTIILK